jgi:hypothetical protein
LPQLGGLLVAQRIGARAQAPDASHDLLPVDKPPDALRNSGAMRHGLRRTTTVLFLLYAHARFKS